VLQCVYSVLQCDAVCYNVREEIGHCDVGHCCRCVAGVLQSVAECCNVMQGTAGCCRCVTVRYSAF